MRRYLIVIIMGLFVLAGCSSQAETLADSSYTLENVYYYLQAVTDLEARGILAEDDAAVQREFYLQQAEYITGQSLTEAELADYIYGDEGQSLLRFLNFVNLIWVFASLIIVLSSVWIFARYIFPILKQVPIVVYEILLYIACAGFIVGASYFEPEDIRQFVTLPGVLGLFFLLPFSYSRHMPSKRGVMKTSETLHNEWLLQLLAILIIWGSVAIAYESLIIGFLTVPILMMAIAISPFAPFMTKLMGFDHDDVAPVMLIASLALVMIFFAAEAFNIAGVYADVFEPAVFWIGTDVYFITLGIMATRIYHKDNRGRYLRWQLISIVSGIVALFIGTYWQIPVMQEIAGTYFLIYLLEKYVEMQSWRQHWAWASLGLGIILYLAALMMNTYPQFFLLQ